MAPVSRVLVAKSGLRLRTKFSLLRSEDSSEYKMTPQPLKVEIARKIEIFLIAAVHRRAGTASIMIDL